MEEWVTGPWDDEEPISARGEVGRWQVEVTDEPEWFEIHDEPTLREFHKVFGRSALEDELYDWPREDLINLIEDLANLH